MREGWTIRTIGEVALHLCDGSHNPPVGIDFSEYPMLSSKNIFFDSYDYSEPRYLTKEQFDIENKRTNVSDGDILLTIVGTIGRVCCIKEPFQPFTLQRSVAVIKPNKNIIISRYLMYCLCGLNAYFNKEAKGVAQKGIYLKQLSKISIPVPPLQEQERIVAELDLLTGIIDKQKQQLKELDTLAQSIFYDMFGNPEYNEKGWGQKTMGEIGSLQRGSGLSKKDLVEEGFPCILYGQIHTKFGAYAERNIAFIPEDLVHTAKIARSGDLVMALTSEDVEGSCKSVAWLGNYDVAVGSDAAIFRHSENGIYLSYYTQTRAFYNEKAKYARGFKVTHISTKDIATIPVMIPPRLLQDEFALKVQFIEKQKESINRSIAESQKLFDYTMDKYFG